MLTANQIIVGFSNIQTVCPFCSILRRKRLIVQLQNVPILRIHCITQNLNGIKMTNQQICDFYDANPDLTLAELSRLTGLTVDQLKTILQTPPPVQQYGRMRSTGTYGGR